MKKQNLSVFKGVLRSLVIISGFLVFLFPNPAFSTAYTVNSLGDAGTGAGVNGDLRYCINTANAIAGPHTISFTGLSGTITLTSTLPVFTRQISILGNTGTGYAVNAPVIQINATSAGWGFLFNNTGGANSVIRGLVINRAQFTNIEINGVNGVTVQDCFIGTNTTGTASAGTNPNFGVQMINSSNNVISNNVISGHATHGILVNVNSLNNTIKGNKIGTNLAGNAAIPNAYHGIEANNNSTGTIIGGSLASDRNIISGNTHHGISLVGGSGSAQITNNYIGVTSAGTAALGNGEHGILIDNSASVVILNNVVSSNQIFGVLIINSDNHTIKGNKAGTNAAGTAALGNVNAGVSLVNSDFTTIGGVLAGEGNVFSGNGDVGLRLETSTNITVQGNFIGTNAAGTGAVGNNSSGIFAVNGCNNNRIGGNSTAARNIISCNRIHGMQYMVSSNDLIIEGNYIGTDVNGGGAATTFGNGEIGIIINDNCLRPRIGGTTIQQRNVISGNGRLWVSGSNNGTGIQMIAGVLDAVITGNFIGIAGDGVTAMGNRENGVVILGGCDNLTFGGNTSAMRNLVSSNGYQGMVINGANNADIIGNYFGLDGTGTMARGNGQSGIICIFSNNNEIGRANTFEGNVIANNGEEGIHLVGGTNNIVYNNYIGVAANGTTAMGNKNGGVFIQGVAGAPNGSNNIIGGLGANQPNIIAYSTGTGSNAALGNGFGVGVAHNDEGLKNMIIGNKIFCNAGLGIDLNFFGLFGGTANGVGNGGKTPPSITAVTATTTTGTGVAGEVVHVYSNTTCQDCEGETYLGTATITAGGTWSVTHASVSNPTKNSATATNPTQGTSEFSCNLLLPVWFLNFYAKAYGDVALLEWNTSWEVNNQKFVIERSADGIHFEPIGEVKGSINSNVFTSYSFTDSRPLSGVSYYRLRQIDLGGQFEYSPIRSVNFGAAQVLVYPNPSTDHLMININGIDCTEPEFSLYNNLGEEVLNFRGESQNQLIDISEFADGIYYLNIKCEEKIFTKKILKSNK